MSETAEEVKEITIRRNGTDEITIGGLTPQEKETLLAAFSAGTMFVRNREGSLQAVSAFEKLPDPIRDPEMHQFWKLPSKDALAAPRQMTTVLSESFDENSSPSIHIKHLCGYYYSPKNYVAQAERAASYGFEVMRSQRGEDGQYWETWYLPGLWAAKGDLAETTKGIEKEKDKLKKALDFLSRHLRFGTLDVCVQKLAMPTPE